MLLTNYHADLKQGELQGQAVHVLKPLELTRNFSVHKCRTEGPRIVSQLMTNFLTLMISLVVFKQLIVCISLILFSHILYQCNVLSFATWSFLWKLFRNIFEESNGKCIACTLLLRDLTSSLWILSKYIEELILTFLTLSIPCNKNPYSQNKCNGTLVPDLNRRTCRSLKYVIWLWYSSENIYHNWLTNWPIIFYFYNNYEILYLR